MKLIVFLILLSIMQVFASESYSQNTKLTFDMEDVTVKDVLTQIEDMSEFYFLYSAKIIDVNREVNISVSNEKISGILNKVFPDDNVDYIVKGRQIVLTSNALADAFRGNDQQQKTITGTVTDENGQTLPGVTVVIKGTTQGTVTNTDGNYSIANIPENATLVFSFVGMVTQEFIVDKQTTIDVTMETDAIGIDEVVAIGYGTIRSSQVTGAIAKVKGESLEELNVGRVDKALMGKLAGVQVQQLSGAPGRPLDIKVRGTSSINFTNSPLYVVDGYPIDGNLSTINTNDIESIEVLKDAASTAIYGSRGSNGVILITTKVGKTGKPQLSVNVYYGIQKRFSKYDVLNRDEWIDWAIEERNNSWEMRGGDRNDPNSARSSSSYWIDPVWISNPTSLPDNDWQDIVDRVAPVQSYQLSASGANDVVKYYISGNYYDQEGIIANSYYKKLSFQSNIETKFSDIVTMGLNLSGAVSEQNDPETDSYGGAISRSWMIIPVAEIDQNTERTGYYPYAASFLVNPYEWMNETLNQNDDTYLLSNIYFNISLAKNLNWRSSFGMERRNHYNQYFKKNYVNRGRGSSGKVLSSINQNYLTEHTLKYQLEKSDWVLDLMGGFTYQANNYQEMYLRKSGFPDESIYTLNVASLLNAGHSLVTQWSLMSFIGRMNLAVKDKYLLTANIRRDGSSRFGSNNRWGWFPSLSLGWRLTEEEFLKDTEWLNNLKLRGSYGVVGNNNIGNYSAIGRLAIDNAIIGSPGGVASGFAPGSFSNTSLGWEKTLTKNIGIDIGLVKNRIQMSADYYISNTEDLLLNLQIPQVTGFSSSLQNVGEIQNKGFEFELNTTNINKAFKWNTSFNISLNRNKVLSLGPEDAPVYGYLNGYNVTITEVGKPIGSYYMFAQEGVFMDQADFDNNPHYKTQQVGDIKYKDYDNDGDIDVDDIHNVGHSNSDFYWGMQNTFSYKSIDLSIVMDGQHGGQGINMAMRSAGQSRMNEWGYWRNRWKSPENPGDGMTPRAVKSVNMTTPSTFWLFDTSYWSIRNVILGYNFPKNIARKIPGVSSLRVYSSIENLFMQDSYHHTPMSANHSNSPLTPNADYAASYPIATTYTFGINLKF